MVVVWVTLIEGGWGCWMIFDLVNVFWWFV
jgi:hypothetical protein